MGMKLAIVGSRDLDEDVAARAIYAGIMSYVECWGEDVNEIVSGGAKGADTLAKKFTEDYHIKYTEFLPDWKTHGRGAGFVRNGQIADYADKCLAVWNGDSNGTRHAIECFLERGKDVTVVRVPHRPDDDQD